MIHPIIALKEKLHPVLLAQMPAMRDFELKCINQKPEIAGPVLYLITHMNVHDAPIAMEVIKDHFYILRAKQKLSFINRFFFAANGNIVVDRDNRKSGIRASMKMTKLLQNGKNVVMFPEGTWCVKPSTPINHCHWGWVEIAKNSGATVLPVAFEYYECTDNLCYVNFGTPFRITEQADKVVDLLRKKEWLKSQNDALEDMFATLKFEIWQQFPVQSRDYLAGNLWNGILTWRYYELGTTRAEMTEENKYIIGNEDEPEKVMATIKLKNQ